MAAIYQTGIDVSRYQGTIDWAAVARAGKQFAVIRAVSSNNSGVYVDPMFEKNYAGAKAAGLRVGVYYYTYAQTESYADRELEALTAVLAGKKLEYPVFVDMEAEGIAALGRTRATQLALYALEKLRAAGWYPGLYTYSNFAKNRLDMAKLSAYPFFVADYTGSVTYPGAYQMWQYSSTGRVPGISGNVDLDHSYMDFLPAIQAGGYNGYEPEIPGLEMVPVPGLKLEVYGTLNCEYFYKPDIYDVAGTLPVGRYEAVAQSVGRRFWPTGAFCCVPERVARRRARPVSKRMKIPEVQQKQRQSAAAFVFIIVKILHQRLNNLLLFIRQSG